MNLFLLSAPYQILNAMELIYHFSFENNRLWIIETGHFDRVQFESVIEQAMWQSVEYYDFRYKLTHLNYDHNWPRNFKEQILEWFLMFDQFLKRRRADKMARGILYPVNNLVLGNYQRNYDQHMRHFANILPHERVILLDVGTDTVRINTDRKLDSICKNNDIISNKTITALKSHIKNKFFAWDVKGVPSVMFFTAYNIELFGKDSVVKNDYNYLKSLVKQSKCSSKVFFIGQPLVEQGYVSPDTFKKFLLLIKNYFDSFEIFYVPHPRELESQQKIVREIGFEIAKHIAPIEYALASSGFVPGCISSFFSSALENLAIIFETSSNYKAFKINSSNLMKDIVEINLVYEQFSANKNAKIEIIELV